jgi:hypothetical protein
MQRSPMNDRTARLESVRSIIEPDRSSPLLASLSFATRTNEGILDQAGGVRIASRSPRKRGQNCAPVHTF